MKSENMEFNISQEINFLSLFDYRIINLGLGRNLEWTIVDTNNNQSGFISRRRYRLKDGKLTWGYYTFFTGYNFVSKNIRLENEENKTYSVLYTNKNNKDIRLNVNLGTNPSLAINDGNQNLAYLDVSNNEVKLSFDMDTSENKVRQSILYQGADNSLEDIRGDKSYVYELSYFPKKGPKAGEKISRACSFSQINENLLYYINTSKDGDKAVNKRQLKLLDGTVERALIQHKDGIRAIRYFQHRVIEFYPFKKDIVEIMLSSSEIGQELCSLMNEKKYTK